MLACLPFFCFEAATDGSAAPARVGAAAASSLLAKVGRCKDAGEKRELAQHTNVLNWLLGEAEQKVLEEHKAVITAALKEAGSGAAVAVAALTAAL